jgi:hypothetical protein
MISRAISTISSPWCILVEESLHEAGGGDEVSATSEGRVEAGDEVVEMSTENTGQFQQHRRPPTTHHGDTQHSTRQVDHWDINDEESHAGATFILREGPDQGHNQG